MSAVTALPLRPSRGRPFTRADAAAMSGRGRVYELVDGSLRSPGWTPAELAELPDDDGYRYELLDGALLVTPAPSLPHQTVLLEVAVLLRAATPPEMQAIVAPFAVLLSGDTELQPDVLVARRADLTQKELLGAPVLAVEVLSPSTRTFDVRLKRERYERAGTPAYWVVDPLTPRLRAWELDRTGTYAEVADVTGDEAFEATVPFPVTVVPSALARG